MCMPPKTGEALLVADAASNHETSSLATCSATGLAISHDFSTHHLSKTAVNVARSSGRSAGSVFSVCWIVHSSLILADPNPRFSGINHWSESVRTRERRRSVEGRTNLIGVDGKMHSRRVLEHGTHCVGRPPA